MSSALIVVLAFLFLAIHLPYLPASLEDLDSINFALGVRDFDVAEHQPHPPGYPLFILAAKATRALIGPEHRALSALGIVAGALGVIAIAALFRRVDEEGGPSATAATERMVPDGDSAVSAVPVVGTALAIASPMYWFTAARPLSDTTGLAVAVAVQALILSARTDAALIVAAFCAALAAGFRSQAVWLTLPLLVFARLRRPDPFRPDGPPAEPGARGFPKSLALHVLAYLAGILVWAVPLVALTGGPTAYWKALSFQGSADLSDIRMLGTTRTVREVIDVCYYAFVAPWAVWPLAAAVLALAAAGAAALMLRRRATVVILGAAFGPYFLFDILFQETFTSRYALPLVIPVAYLAAAGAAQLPRRAGLAAIAVLAVICAHVGGTSVAAYARQKAPAFRLLDEMRPAAAQAPPVLAMDRREEFDLRRAIRWVGASMPALAQRLASPPQREWLELVKYWNAGGRAPVWFVADPKRTDIDLVQHRPPAAYRWALPYRALIDGVRPDEMDWYRIDRPEWYVGRGWALTPESAGVAEVDRTTLANGPITGWVHRSVLDGGGLVFGGRSFEPTVRPRLTLSIATWSKAIEIASGAFLATERLPMIEAASEYVPVHVSVDPPSRVAVEQFDISRDRPVLGFADGWHEHEYNPDTGLQWRWLSERGELHVLPATPRGPMALHLEGESPRRYFARGSRLVVRVGDRVLFDRTLDSDFTADVPLPDAADGARPQVLTLETDQAYVPAERGWRRSADRRHLGLRIFRCDVRAMR